MATKKANKSGRYRDYVFTYNNYTKEGEEKLKNLSGVKYMIFGHEVCPTTGTPHLQGYIEFKNSRFFPAVKKMFPWWVDFRNGSPEQAATYCNKEGDDVFVKGVMKQQGKRNDLRDIRRMLKDGNNLRQTLKACSSYQHLAIATKTINLYESPRDFRPYNLYIYGPPQQGKSWYARCVFMKGMDVWWSGDTAKWWNGYDGHEGVVLEDIRGNFCTFQWLLRLLDETPCSVETKGGMRQLKARKMCITSCLPPWRLYNTVEDLGQLKGRIDKVLYCPERNKYIEVEWPSDADAEVGGNIVRPVDETPDYEDYAFIKASAYMVQGGTAGAPR